MNQQQFTINKLIMKENVDQNSSRYAIKVITQEYVDQIFDLFKAQLASNEPLSKSYFEMHPQKKIIEQELLWQTFRKSYRKQIMERGISIGCFDLQNKQELVGAILVKDSSCKLIVDDFKEISFLRYGLELYNELLAGISTNHLQIVDSQNIPIVDHWLFFIKPPHQGKGLLSKMVKLSDQLSASKNYQHAVCMASNFKTAKTMKKLGYELIGQTNAKQFQFEGFRHFSHISQDDQVPTLWLKKFNKNSINAHNQN